MTRLDILERLSNITEKYQAMRLLDDLALEEQTPMVKSAINFVIHFVFRKLNGNETGYVDRETRLNLFTPFDYQPMETDWNTWMHFFGVKTAYVREDRDQGVVLQESLPKTAEAAKQRKAGVHFVPFILGDKPTPGHTSIRSKDNVQSCVSFFADLDGDKSEGWEKIRSCAILPSVIVETRRGWHCYWPLIAPVSVSTWEKVQSTINEKMDGDKACNTPGHSLRMPSSWHCKGLWDGNEAYYTKIAWADWRKFTYSEMEVAFPPKRENPRPSYGSYKPINGVRMPSTNYLPSGGSHDPLVSEAGRVYAGVKEENAYAARNMVVTWFTSFKENKKPTDDKEAQRRCDELEIKQYGRIVSR